MKWSIVGLLALGIVAALCAAVLVATLQSKSRQVATPGIPPIEASETGELPVLVAASDLEPRTVLTGEGIVTKSMSKATVPEGSFRDPIQIVGKVLLVPLKSGQAFTAGCFASEGSGLRLASALAKGMRAVSVQLSDPMGLESLLYPGSIVDVLASIETKSEDGQQKQTISVTLLQSVVVLGVGDRTVVSPSDPGAAKGILDRGPRPPVTLLVEPKDAELLKLAMQEGSISLALRNPMDESPAQTPGVGIAALSPILAANAERARAKQAALDKERAEQTEQERQKRLAEMEKERYALEKSRNEIEIARNKFERERIETERAAELAKYDEVRARWETLIVRGGVSETKTFDLPEPVAPDKSSAKNAENKR
jgi:pilus assembly protein CpaB